MTAWENTELYMPDCGLETGTPVLLSVGMDYQNWFAGLSYDINFSKLVPASNARGGIEIAVRYILHQFKPKKITHRICPDYI